jgi:hypothetical protein
MLALAAFAFAQPALAKDASKPMTAQQSAFAACAHQSKGIKGDGHKKFMSDCLKGKTGAAADKADAKVDAAATKTDTKADTAANAAASTKAGGESKVQSQREKMKTCNADAKSKQLKGDARKTFMSSCLKAG